MASCEESRFLGKRLFLQGYMYLHLQLLFFESLKGSVLVQGDTPFSYIYRYMHVVCYVTCMIMIIWPSTCTSYIQNLCFSLHAWSYTLLPYIRTPGSRCYVCYGSDTVSFQKWPEAEFYIIPDAGHSAKEPGTAYRLLEATDKYKSL